MGSSHSNHEEESFRRQDWQLVNMSESSAVWQNRRDPTQKIQQFSLYSSSQQECNRQRQMYYLRKSHPHLVAAVFLNSQSTSQFCSSSYQQKLFIQRIPIRLSDIEHIPFPDNLHVYKQCLKGFSELANHFGFFAVEEEFIGINQQGLVKIWMNTDFSKAQIIGGKTSQEAMVRNIIDIVDRNTDENRDYPSVKDYIYQQSDKIQFQQAINLFNSYTQHYCNGFIPQKLQCIDKVGGIFAISNRIVSPPSTVIYNQRPNPPQMQHPNPIYINTNRPQLIGSAIMNSPTSPQNSVHYEPINRVRPHNILIPLNQNNLVDVRQASATFHGSPRAPINSFVNKSPVGNISQGRLQSRVVFVPAPIPPQNQPIKLATQNPSKVQQNFVGNRIEQQVVQINQPSGKDIPNRNVNSSSQRNSLQVEQGQQIKVTNKLENKLIAKFPGNYTSNQNFPLSKQQPKPESSLSQPNPLQRQKSVNSLIKPLQTQYQSQVVEKNNYNSRANVPSPKASYQLADLLMHSNTVSKHMSVEQSPQLSYPSYSAVNQLTYNVESIYPSYNSKQYINTEIQKQTEFKPLSINDGKSSSDFFSKLNGFGGLGELNRYEAKPYEIMNEKSNANREVNQDYKNPFYSNVNSHKQLVSYTEINYLEQIQPKFQQNNSDEQFGRNAVSNIFHNQKPFSNPSNKLVEPLKFQNNLDMKYSIFKSDEYKTSNYTDQPTYGTYAYRSYEANYDPDLMADIKNLKA